MLNKTLVLSLLLTAFRAPAQQARIYFVDVGQGAATLVVSPTGKTLLVDGGPSGGGTGAIVPLLNTLGIAAVDLTVLTHYHIDHDTGLTETINAGKVAGTAFDNGDGADVQPPGTGSTRTAYLNYLAAIAGHAGTVTRQAIAPGQVIDLGGGMRATCLAARGLYLSGGALPVSLNDLNTQSISLLIEYNNFDFLVSGDLTGGGSTSADRPPDLESFMGQLAGDVDVIELDHHGSLTSSSRRLLRAAKAEAAVAEMGEAGGFGHPALEIVNRYLNIPVTNGNVNAGTGVPPPGTGPVFYQVEASPAGDGRTSPQGYSGAAQGNAGSGTILLRTDGVTQFDLQSFSDGGVRIVPALHTYPLDAAGAGVTLNFPPTVIPSISPPVPLATDPVAVSAQVNDREDAIVSVTLSYSLNGTAQTPLPMTLGGGLYQATIPPQPDGTRVDFSVAAVAGGQTTSFAGGYFSGTTPIASLRALDANGEPLYLDYPARITGTVSAGSGLFGAMDHNDDYVEDFTGGINVFRTSLPASPAVQILSLGQTAEVRGLLALEGGQLRLDVTPPFDAPSTPYGRTVLAAGAPPAPATVTLAQLASAPESREGRLVSVLNCSVTAGTIPAAGAAADATLTVSDGTGTFTLKIDPDTDIPGLATPAALFTLTGIVQQDDGFRPFTSGYALAPRSREDLGVIAPLIAIAAARIDSVTNASGSPPPDFVPDLKDQPARIRGVVTSPDFRGGSGVDFYLQDASGGINLFNSAMNYGPFAVGDNLEVTGTIRQGSGLTGIDPGTTLSRVTLLPPGTLPPVGPQLITLSQLGNGGAGEALEGRLVRVDRAVITAGTFPAAGSSASLTISDSTGSATLRIDNATDIDGTQTPGGPFSVTGIATQFDAGAPFDSGYQLQPRSTADLIIPLLAAAPSPLAFGNAPVGVSAAGSVTVYNNRATTITLTAPFSFTGADALQFSAGPPGAATLPAGGSTAVPLAFSPSSTGAKSAQLQLADTDGDSAAVDVSGAGVAPAGGAVVISELRTRGPNGASDEFVELYNGSAAVVNIGGWKLRGSNSAGSVSDRAVIPANTLLPARGHYLFVNAAAGAPNLALADQTFATGITDDGGVALTTAGNAILDAAGMSAGSAFKEGTTLPPLTTGVNRGYERRAGGCWGGGVDTNDNGNDFQLTAPSDPQNLASAPSCCPLAAPSTPAAVPACGTVALSWPPVYGATGYQVVRAPDGSCAAPSPLGSTPVAAFTDPGAAPFSLYSYRVIASSGCAATPAGGCTPVTAAGTLTLRSENFESGAGGWSFTGGASAGFALAPAPPGAGAFALRASGGGGTADCAAATAAAPVAIAANAVSARLEFFAQSALGANDAGRVEVSPDGVSWTPLASLAYPGAAPAGAGCAAPAVAAGEPVFSDASAGARYSADLSGWRGQSVYLRFRLATGGVATPAGGWTIDDLVIHQSLGTPPGFAGNPLSAGKSSGELLLTWPPAGGNPAGYFLYAAPSPALAPWPAGAAQLPGGWRQLSADAVAASPFTPAGALSNPASVFYLLTPVSCQGEQFIP